MTQEFSLIPSRTRPTDGRACRLAGTVQTKACAPPSPRQPLNVRHLPRLDVQRQQPTNSSDLAISRDAFEFYGNVEERIQFVRISYFSID